ncbi:FAD-dependent oxidoreductase [Mesorhizobium sp. M4B.F.Ca.ET.215.01.1.1]|uniref:flavin-containing monooxygenase n=1 Tax=unclassified Mesorhizobium TaxID=325217 RepID=UPI000FD1F78A|nr:MULTISPECIES: NAD(P)/FAD-dependent oxidoreductase [unclassified Mesorhizobium]RUW27454.1 FAD-dependent oxidoreductase [Mesorhizobium sp. M4B.F.Ca.ET.013.02.1.1]RWF67694.1 MAG: FAD-dependent oxidoreductase [Mesorhizobium sp.]TGQ18386.1 FAD-dependent oxidoreductase [Mesorhizobium sp. M4B.F.Ca.ET.215.01.1.1]TGQ37131.1 FAD-dependent oxidoreductase [Mesorhizobium sp. M4B.F.Ca.ET.214.01.1.1]TGQ49357.1 FAD-dependent oxidoreductase [Mesorhizobium sp. M00.F.Ca.ET.220.01.1.1]
MDIDGPPGVNIRPIFDRKSRDRPALGGARVSLESLYEEHDTVIIGGGQAGLAMSYHLRQRGRQHIVLERFTVAERWRSERWDSLRFQLPNRWLDLPGKPYAGTEPDGFVHHSEVLRFLVDYAAEIEAPVRTGVEVTGLSRDDRGAAYHLETANGPIRARHVVIATGPFQRPIVPGYSHAVPASICQIDATCYRNPQQLPPGAVLVVGSGNSGCQIADELLRSGRRVFLAVSRHSRVPRRYRGQDLIWWYENLGRFDVTIDSFPNRRYPPSVILTGMDGGYDLDPRRLGVEGATLLGRLVGIADGTAVLADDAVDALAAADRSYAGFLEAADHLAATTSMQSEVDQQDRSVPPLPFQIESVPALKLSGENVRTIVWASGYAYNYDWVNLKIIDANGTPVQQRGVTPCPGVYFLGLHWMHTFRSAVLSFVGRDAAYIADHIESLAPI